MDTSEGPSDRRAEGTFMIVNQLGLHARAAAQLVNLANRFESKITVIKGRDAANGKSIMGVLMLAAAAGTRLKVDAEGPDCEEAVRRIGELIGNRFGEDE